MAQPPSRSILKMIFTNFINSIRPRQITGNLKGTDYNGTKYYEIPANPSIGKRKPQRWFEPIDKENFQQEIPGEWEGWLRGRRPEPPSEEEVLRNLQLIHTKKENAAKLEAKYATEVDQTLLPPETRGAESFPKYGDEYEVMPGKSIDSKSKKIK